MSAPYVQPGIWKYQTFIIFFFSIEIIIIMTGCFKGYQGKSCSKNNNWFILSTGSCKSLWSAAVTTSSSSTRCIVWQEMPITPPQNAPQLRCDETSSFDRCSSQATFSTSSRAVTVKRRLLWENFPPTIRRPHTMVEGQHTGNTQNTKHKHTQFYTDCVSWTGFQMKLLSLL